MTTSRLLLLRHTAVSPRYAGRCYGRLDVALSRDGVALVQAVADALAPEPFGHVFTSPSRRSRLLGGRIAGRLRKPLTVVPELSERCFGSWEGKSWDDIWATEGEAMNGMLDTPATYRPGGGETTAELGLRLSTWFQGLSADGPALAVTHGGPAAALAGTLLRTAPRAWLDYVPPPGHGLWIETSGKEWRITRWQPHVPPSERP